MSKIFLIIQITKKTKKEEIKMTICICATCSENNEEIIAFAVDHMISTGIGEFEHGINKYRCLNKNTVAMIAGNALLMDYFLNEDYTNKSYLEIQEIIEEKFKQKRLEIIEKEVLNVFSIDFDYVKELLKNPITNDFQAAILKRISSTKLNTAILLIGFEDGKAKISEITDSEIGNFDQINFHTIGSGLIQAQNTLLFQKHSKECDLKTTLYNVHKAKKNAEVMQGVGKKTDIGFLNKNGITMLNNENIKILDEIYYIELNCGKQHVKLKDLQIKYC